MDNYVTDDAGTGVVQQAPYFGEVGTCFPSHTRRGWGVLILLCFLRVRSESRKPDVCLVRKNAGCF